MPSERVVAFEDLDASERSACEIAVVANPQIEDVLSIATPGTKHSR